MNERLLPPAWKAWLTAFEDALQAQGRSVATRAAYARDVRAVARVLLQQVPSMEPAGVTVQALTAAFADDAVQKTTRGTARSAAGRFRLTVATQRFFAWAVADGRMAEDPAGQLRAPQLHRTAPVFLTDAEVTRLRKVWQGRAGETVQRDRMLIELFLGTGIRLQELIALDIDDVRLDTKHLHVRSAKGGVPQVKFLHTRLRGLLRPYLKWRLKLGTETCPALFLSQRGTRISPRQVAYRLAYWLGEAGIDRSLTPHSLRHTFATRLYARTQDLLIVQRALGHRQVSTTAIYTHVVDDVLEEALERL